MVQSEESKSEINVSDNNTIYSSVDGVLFDKNQTTLLKFPSYNKNYIYDVPEGVETIKTGAIEVFYMMKKKGNTAAYMTMQSNLWHVYIPASVTKIESQAITKTVNWNGNRVDARFSKLKVFF